ncbi:hypothetical protein LCGC14_1784050 [marine sediment metagenome]|uniref:Glycosyltransferase 2-like domain-containing protein n=1 Tax=marine sediment metagenome TaxID=412755 RepID=A0A0F9GUG5_9ZZZZ
MKKEKFAVSLVIPTYNRILKLFRLLKSLDKLNPIPDEIIIVDDNSTDGSGKLLDKWKRIKREYHKEIILKSQNKGPADSRNLGNYQTRNELIAFTDDDVVVHTKWIKRITSKLLNADEEVVGVGGIVKSINNDILSKYYVEHKILEAPRQLNYLPTVNCCFRKQPIIQIGGFDTTFLFAGGEDTDLGLRLKNRGYTFVKEKKAIIYHDFSPNFLDFCKMWIRYGKGTQLAILNSRRKRQ